MATVFAYGTLINESVMKAVTGRTFRNQNALLHGYARYRVKNETYPGIIPEEDSIVNGKIYFDVDADSLIKLDEFEDEYYERKSVIVNVDGSRTVEAFTYVVREDCKDILTDEKWDAARFEKEDIELFKKKYLSFRS